LNDTCTREPASAPSSWNATRFTPRLKLHRTAPGQFSAPVHVSPSGPRTRGGSVVTTTCSPSSSGPWSMPSAPGSTTNSSPVSRCVVVRRLAGAVIVHVGHASTSPGLVSVVSASTCPDDTCGNGSRKSCPGECERCVVTGTGSIQYGYGQYRLTTAESEM